MIFMNNKLQAKLPVVLELKQVFKHFDTARGIIPILENISFSVQKGEKIAIVGPSGSGKSTLLSLIGLLDNPSSGQVLLEGVDVKTLKEKELSNLRNKKIGFIFQSFELISPFTVFENVLAPIEISKNLINLDHVQKLVSQVGLEHRAEAMPHTLSGGEKQRVAIARALANSPEIILADEPTGSLDIKTGEKVLNMLMSAVDLEKKTLIIITHDQNIAAKMDRVLEIKDRSINERT